MKFTLDIKENEGIVVVRDGEKVLGPMHQKYWREPQDLGDWATKRWKLER